jgi:hypothetical protein
MALIVRIDVDRPYGKQGVVRHVASRFSSDYYLPPMEWLRYLDELKTILNILNANGRSAHVFFRKCTYPTPSVCELMEAGGHQFGLHLENSRSAETFREELESLEQKLQRRVTTFSKHGSGRLSLGRHHYPPYEPERYLPWGKQADMRVFLGNLENPELRPTQDGELLCFPSAFWLEPYWRDTKRFPLQWLLNEAAERDVVMLLHPDNVTADPEIMREFVMAIEKLETAVLPANSLTPSSQTGERLSRRPAGGVQ